MSVTATVRVVHPDLPLSATLAAQSELRIERRYQIAGGDERYGFYSVTAGDADAFEAALGDDPTVAGWLRTAELEDRRLYRIELTDEALVLAPTLASMGIAVAEATGGRGSWWLVLQLPGRDQIAEFTAYCEETGVEVDVERLARTAPDAPTPPLTDAQREALAAAYESGYFDEPRRTSLEELAAELDVSSTAVGGRIRRGTAALVETMLSPGTTKRRTD